MKKNKIISLITTLIVLVVVALTATTGTDDKVSPKEYRKALEKTKESKLGIWKREQFQF